MVLSVSQLNEYVRRHLAADPMLRGVQLSGELSGFKRHTSGHLYFALKDEAARIQCVMFRQSAMGLDFAPQDGMHVTLTGQVSLYTATGSYQFYCEAMRREGVGELYMKFEALKRRLGEEGLFDPSLKKPIPLLPKAVGVVTSETGAVFQDILRVTARRCPGIPIILAPAKVQGEGAAKEIARAIARLNAHRGVDVIICGRGGGSIEDLWPFNEEQVARAIAASDIPVISAVGHETDFTIADFVSDLRAPTPSAAAELAVPVAQEMRGAISAGRERLRRALIAHTDALDARLKALSGSAQFLKIEALMEAHTRHVAELGRQLRAGLEAQLTQRAMTLAALDASLRALSPFGVLDRGYALVRGEAGLKTSVTHAAVGEDVTIILRDGALDAAVTKVTRHKGAQHGKKSSLKL